MPGKHLVFSWDVEKILSRARHGIMRWEVPKGQLLEPLLPRRQEGQPLCS
jgi:hypothetical protein